jgi:FixJ family two-component response regulator
VHATFLDSAGLGFRSTTHRRVRFELPGSPGIAPVIAAFCWSAEMPANSDFRGEIFVIDDDAETRASLSEALGAEGYDVICFADGEGLLSRGKLRMPLCVFVDTGERDRPQFDLVEKLCAERWPVPIFATSAKASIAMAVEAIRKGAFDFIEKPLNREDIVARVRDALGEVPLSDISLQLQDGIHLTGRELEVLEGIAFGETTKQIALRLGLSARTVESHRASIIRKSGARNSTELLRRVLVQGHCR